MADQQLVAATTDNQKRQQKSCSLLHNTEATTPAPTLVTMEASQLQQQHQKSLRKMCLEAKTLHIALGLVSKLEPVRTSSVAEHMELSQIELIYRAEGNANLVLMLPQFKKVLRLPKMLSANSSRSNTQHQQREFEQTDKQQQQQSEQQQLQEHESVSDSTLNQNAKDKIADLTMADFAAYIEIIRRLLGNEYVFEPEIVRIPKLEDRRWINEHIRAMRPAHRRDKEFCGEFGLLLPDATRLPIAFDILLSNLQSSAKETNKDAVSSAEWKTAAKTNPESETDAPTSEGKKIFSSCDTFAIEIKPKQGWLLEPSDVNDLFDIKPEQAAPMDMTSTTTSTAEMEAQSAPTARKMSKKDIRCRYCTMQFLKLRQRKINKRSAYCPIELFSGHPIRMKAALDALLQCPQNNLKIFRNGELIYGDQHSVSYEELQRDYFPGSKLQLIKDLVVTCLLRDYTDEAAEKAKTVAGQQHLSATAARTPATDPELQVVTASATTADAATICATLLPAEYSSETFKAPGAATAMATLSSSPASWLTAFNVARRRMAPSLPSCQPTQAQITEVEMLRLPKNSVLQKILHLQLLAKHNLSELRAAGFAHKSLKSYNALRSLLTKCDGIKFDRLSPLEAYLLGATALDCSVMLAFQQVNVNADVALNCVNFVDMPNCGGTYLTKITLLDLDPKPDSHFCKYVQQTCDAFRECEKQNSGQSAAD